MSSNTELKRDCRTNTVTPKEYSPTLSVVIPAYNEVETISEIIRRVDETPIDLQIVIVDDGSSDGTAETISKIAESNTACTALFHSRNMGKGRAIRTALEQCEGQYVLIQDADLEYDPRDYNTVLAPLKNSQAHLVLGSRYLNSANRDRRIGLGSRIAVSIINSAMRLVYGVRLTDSATCYKACKTSWLKSVDLECERFEFCTEILAKGARSGLQIKEVPIRYSPRTRYEGKKIGWRDGWFLLMAVFKWRNWNPPAAIRATADSESNSSLKQYDI